MRCVCVFLCAELGPAKAMETVSDLPTSVAVLAPVKGRCVYCRWSIHKFETAKFKHNHIEGYRKRFGENE